ncbi:hypothetical protein PEL8287_02331 [Roseovarius litorisediminis]|uniref:DoxX-like family protein n=1 Tax=Roseovarius litorisediminis TaxID=1312363 RepID=A0A1Y5SPL8_9RHOB|nr:hypothetical protein [Roseovarius litorisediminis]SLN45455.1 hypothetical protein PEL8287_02331 [Roseovarius litorisediminis]
MTKTILLGLCAWFIFVAAYLLLAPHSFYENIPGVSDSGPYNSHFMRDVGFAFLASGAAIGFGALKGDRRLVLFGAAYPVLHGGFHVMHWLEGGVPFSLPAMAELFPTAGLAILTLLLALRVKGGAA